MVELISLGRDICNAVHSRSAVRSEELLQVITDPKHPGHEFLEVDRVCRIEAKRVVDAWSRRTGARTLVIGEDIRPTTIPADRDVIICIDALDGTQHWARRKNLYCTAISMFSRTLAEAGRTYGLACSVIMDADQRFFSADNDGAFVEIHGDKRRLSVESAQAVEFARAHVCTVARRRVQYTPLAKRLCSGLPFSGLYTFGGNPVIAALALGEYDAVFQLARDEYGDSLGAWDWLPGLHIAFQAKCTVLSPDGNPFNVIERAQDALQPTSSDMAFVVAPSRDLAVRIARWMAEPGCVDPKAVLDTLHPEIRQASGKLFLDGHYAKAIENAFIAIELRVREMARRSDFGTDMMAKAFPDSGVGINMRTEPGESGDSEQRGFRFLFMGAISGIRNPRAHGLGSAGDPQLSVEYLAFASMLMRRLDICTPRGS